MYVCMYVIHTYIFNKKTELNIMVDDIKPHIIGITESWANNDITNAELGLEGYVMFRKDRIGRRGGGVLPVADQQRGHWGPGPRPPSSRGPPNSEQTFF